MGRSRESRRASHDASRGAAAAWKKKDWDANVAKLRKKYPALGKEEIVAALAEVDGVVVRAIRIIRSQYPGASTRVQGGEGASRRRGSGGQGGDRRGGRSDSQKTRRAGRQHGHAGVTGRHSSRKHSRRELQGAIGLGLEAGGAAKPTGVAPEPLVREASLDTPRRAAAAAAAAAGGVCCRIRPLEASEVRAAAYCCCKAFCAHAAHAAHAAGPQPRPFALRRVKADLTATEDFLRVRHAYCSASFVAAFEPALPQRHVAGSVFASAWGTFGTFGSCPVEGGGAGQRGAGRGAGQRGGGAAGRGVDSGHGAVLPRLEQAQGARRLVLRPRRCGALPRRPPAAPSLGALPRHERPSRDLAPHAPLPRPSQAPSLYIRSSSGEAWGGGWCVPQSPS